MEVGLFEAQSVWDSTAVATFISKVMDSTRRLTTSDNAERASALFASMEVSVFSLKFTCCDWKVCWWLTMAQMICFSGGGATILIHETRYLWGHSGRQQNYYLEAESQPFFFTLIFIFIFCVLSSHLFIKSRFGSCHHPIECHFCEDRWPSGSR